ncbi:MAG: acyl-CoA thioesterase [Eubacteriales bacterium]
MNQSEMTLIVRYAETDRMGIVHHSHYAVWFEAGRTDFLKKAGVSYSSLEAMGFMLPLYEMQCKFKSPAEYEDEILVITKISFMSPVRLHLSYQIINSANSKLLVTGETMHAWTDKTFKPVNAQKAIPEIYLMLNRIYAEE